MTLLSWQFGDLMRDLAHNGKKQRVAAAQAILHRLTTCWSENLSAIVDQIYRNTYSRQLFNEKKDLLLTVDFAQGKAADAPKLPDALDSLEPHRKELAELIRSNLGVELEGFTQVRGSVWVFTLRWATIH